MNKCTNEGMGERQDERGCVSAWNESMNEYLNKRTKGRTHERMNEQRNKISDVYLALFSAPEEGVSTWLFPVPC